MGYRDELEAALARIAALERELAELQEQRRSWQAEAIARQDAEASLQIAKFDAKAQAARDNAVHEVELSTLRAELQAMHHRAEAERAARQAEAAAQQAVLESARDQALATCALLEEERDVLLQLNPRAAAELYERRASACRKDLEQLRAKLTERKAAEPQSPDEAFVHEHNVRSLSRTVDALAASLAEHEQRAAAMRAKVDNDR